ncbi:MAG: psrP3 [Bacteroidetes bacterium]|nr:psrP3 [Bacteroidota bacterium]
MKYLLSDKIIANAICTIVCICNLSILKAQFPNPLDFNSATNAANNGTIPLGSNDLHWTVALTNSLGIYVPAVNCGNQATCCWVNSPYPNANWITYPHTCSSSPAEHSCLGNVDEFYKLTFNLPGTNCGQAINTASAYCLSLDFFADNWVSEIYVNNIITFINPNGFPYGASGFSSPLTVCLCNNWMSGSNTVIVHVKSGAPTFPGWTGFLVQANQTVNTTVGVPFSATINQSNVSCFGGNNGSATVTASGGSSGFTYSWIPSGGTSNIANGLSAGNYSVIVSSGSCSTTATFTITQPAAFSINASSNTTLCPGSNVVLTASGASTYSWNTGASSSSITINSPGNYVVTGVNASGCTNSKTITVTSGPSPTINISGTNTICVGSAAVLTANGANTYTWNTGQQSSGISVSPPATTVYSVTGSSPGVTCSSTQTVVVTVNAFLTLGISGLTSICTGNSTTLTASGANSYSWSTGSQSNTISAVPLSNSNFSVVGTNTLTGCTGSIGITVTVNPLPQISVNSPSICPGKSALLAASGANTYTWSNGAFTQSTSVNSSGIYTVNAASSSGCLNSTTVNVTQLSLPSLTISGANVVCQSQTSSLVAFGATSYTWSTGALTQTVFLQNNASSIYSVSGTDNATGCTNTQTFAVNVNPLPTILLSGNAVTCDGASTTLMASGADTYSWSSGQTSSQITVNPPGTNAYVVTGTNTITGCQNFSSLTVTVSATPNLNVTGGTICAGQPFTLIAQGASSYVWNTGATTASAVVSPIVNSVYTVTGYGTSPVCNISRTVQVNVKAAPQLTLNTNYLSICKGSSAVLSVTGSNSYIWSDGQTNSTILIAPAASMIYSVSSLEAGSGCISTKTVQVQVNDLPDVRIIGDTTLCDGERTVLAASGANSYTWSTSATTNKIDVLINENALYFLFGFNTQTGCSNMDSIRLGNSEKCCEIYIPNSFTPNEDGINENFGALSLCKFTEFKFFIFDKWGEQIFSSNDINLKWNGYYKGELCKQDVYVYMLRAKRKGVSIKTYIEKTGHVSLIR